MRVFSLGLITVPSPGTPISIGSVQAVLAGTEVGTFAITTGTNDKLSLSLDRGVTVQTVTLANGASRTATQVVSDINGAVTGMTAYVAAGRVVIASNATGPAATITVGSIPNDAYTTLGFTGGAVAVGASDIMCSKIRLTPLKDNSGDIYVGCKVNFDAVSGDGLLDRLMKPLATPSTLDSFVVECQSDCNVLHTMHYFIDSDNADDGVMASIWVV